MTMDSSGALVPDGGRVESVGFTCLDHDRMPSCFTLTLEPDSTQMGEYSWCKPDYDPVKWHLVRTNQPPAWAELYPGWVSPDMHLVLRIYEAEDHFTRRVTIPSFRIEPERPWRE